jgi:hypothetical protein
MTTYRDRVCEHFGLFPIITSVNLIIFITIQDALSLVYTYIHATTEDKTDDMKDSFCEEFECAFDIPYENVVRRFQCQSSKGRRHFQTTFGSESSHEFSKSNGVRLVNLATSKDLTVNVTT